MDTAVTTLKALADRSRLRIVLALVEHEELCACQLTELLGLAGASVSRHLAQLDRAGLIRGRKTGRWIHYHLTASFAASEPLAWLDRATAADPRRRDDRAALAAIVAEDPAEICRRQRGPTCCPAPATTPTPAGSTA